MTYFSIEVQFLPLFLVFFFIICFFLGCGESPSCKDIRLNMRRGPPSGQPLSGHHLKASFPIIFPAEQCVLHDQQLI